MSQNTSTCHTGKGVLLENEPHSRFSSAEHGLERLARLLGAAAHCLEVGRFQDAFFALGDRLSVLRDQAIQHGWAELGQQYVREHAVFALCHEDPYTARAFAKPRGYAGDAVMLDFVYAGVVPHGTSGVGSGVFTQTTRGPMGLSVVFRRNLLASLINDAVARNSNADILSIASGHCRELEKSFAAESGYQGRFIAFDQDEESCAEVDRCYGKFAQVQVGSIKHLFQGKCDLGRFDLIYSAGLYDYLPTTIARKLTTVLATLLKPGGRLVVANFAPSSQGRGYLEWVMDWRLNYRTVEEFRAVAAPDGRATKHSIFMDVHENVLYSIYRT
jgi:extracellular factor (EF) 3-hydroxypalmitic acid methyl ester biosynthesis protein